MNIKRKQLLKEIQKEFGIGCRVICEERIRQYEKEGWCESHDSNWENEELANAAATYAMSESMRDQVQQWGNDFILYFWPFDIEWLKFTPKNRQRELEKAGALVAAQIDIFNH